MKFKKALSEKRLILNEAESILEDYMNRTFDVLRRTEKFDLENGRIFTSMQSKLIEIYRLVRGSMPIENDLGEDYFSLTMRERLYEMKLCNDLSSHPESNFWAYQDCNGALQTGTVVIPSDIIAVYNDTPELLCDWLNQNESWQFEILPITGDTITISLTLLNLGIIAKITFQALFDGSKWKQDETNPYRYEVVGSNHILREVEEIGDDDDLPF